VVVGGWSHMEPGSKALMVQDFLVETWYFTVVLLPKILFLWLGKFKLGPGFWIKSCHILFYPVCPWPIQYFL
jgi:hypothetical protein